MIIFGMFLILCGCQYSLNMYTVLEYINFRMTEIPQLLRCLKDTLKAGCKEQVKYPTELSTLDSLGHILSFITMHCPKNSEFSVLFVDDVYFVASLPLKQINEIFNA